MTQDRNKRPLHDHLSIVLADAHRALNLKLEQQLKAHNVQVGQWRVLEVLSDNQSRSMGELAELVAMNHPALTKLMDRMVAQGLVMRGLEPTDNRRVIVMITDAGKALCQKIQVQTEQLDAKLVTQIGAERAEILRTMLNDLRHGANLIG